MNLTNMPLCFKTRFSTFVNIYHIMIHFNVRKLNSHLALRDYTVIIIWRRKAGRKNKEG